MVACCGEAASDFDIFGGELEIGSTFVFRERTDDATGCAYNEGAFGNDHALRYKGSSSDDAAWTNLAAIEQDSTHADKDFILDGAGMHDGAMTDGDVVADEGGVIIANVDDNAVLNVATGADMDGVNVTTKNSAVPNAGLSLQGHITDDDGALSDEYLASHRGIFLWKQEII